MTADPYADRFPFADTPPLFPASSTPSVKSEPCSSPNTDSPVPAFSFSYHLHNPTLDSHPLPYPSPPLDRPVFRFGMAHHSDPWSLKHPHHDAQNIALDVNAIPFHDDYDDPDELADLPPSSGPPSHTGQPERIVRRRSSKACDQCRKSKCKCERTADGDACKSCIMLGTPCTFLGPSRKRGPPKGYIDAIEARLHQTEALLGILLTVEAERAEGSDKASSHGKHNLKVGSLEGLLTVLRKDTLAREILNRVDSSPYGVKGRKNGSVKARSHAHAQEHSGSGIDLHSTHPSNEWQDRVAALLSSSLQSQPHPRPVHSSAPSPIITPSAISFSDTHPPRSVQSRHPSVQLSHLSDDYIRRQRRRVDGEEGSGSRGVSAARNGSQSPAYSSRANTDCASGSGYASGYMGTSTDSDSEDDVIEAVGQLSLNEDQQVRYHGKASGLYLLGINTKAEARNEGGIWRFPKARVWPPLPPSAADPPTSPSTAFGSRLRSANPSSGISSSASMTMDGGDLASMLPDPAMQEHLLELYFTYVHTAFPILHKGAFWEGYRSMQNPPTDLPSPSPDQVQTRTGNSPDPSQGRRRHVSHLLLFSMFAMAARYSPLSSPPPTPRCSTPTSPHPPEPTPMWTAGDNFLTVAKNLLDSTYASSLPSTVQALLLLGYREIGIGAMAQAWAYTGMAVRMAQDLGMHRAADGWARAGMGQLFNARQLHERRRIWWGCIILDGYVSTYIGRPLAIFDGDYDTRFPDIEESDERETWAPHPSLPPDIKGHGYRPGAEIMPPVPGHILSCFTASATLSTILSKIVQSLYSIRPTSPRHLGSVHLEGLLDKWYFDLPEHLRFEMRYDSTGNLSATDRRVPPPHILTLHMQYWCTVLLLHRPFIRQIYLLNKHKPDNGDDGDARAASKKNYELCIGAANHIASIVTFYREKYCLQRASVFLCFYVFTAGIMHVTSLSVFQNDPQARMGLTKCIDALQDMEAVWPSAARAHELLRGCDPLNKNENASARTGFGQLVTRQSGQKRAAEHAADSEDAYERSQMHMPSPSGVTLVPSQPYAQPWRSTQYPSDFSAASLSTTQSSSYYPWPSPTDGSSYDPFPGTLSTSVLPQMYSTGLMDERRMPLTSSQHAHNQSRLNGHSTVNGHGGYETTNGGRYPQYWNDYTTFPQMGMAYAQSPSGATQGQDGLYLNESYGGNIYDHPPPP